MSLPALLLAAAAATAAAPPAPTPEFVWLEGEAPTRTTFPFNRAGWGPNGYLSDGAWLTAAVDPGDVANKVPADGAAAAYDFRPPNPGRYDVWARVGYEFARAPFRWRVGGGAWATVGPDALTTDLMAIGDFAEVAWLKLGSVEVTAGGQTLEVTVPRPAANQRLLFGLDAVCLVKGPFLPNGRFKPGDFWKYPVDREAERTTFAFPAAAGPTALPARHTLDLAGTWQIARYDETDVADRTGPTHYPTDPDALYWHGIKVPGDRDAERPELAYCHRYLYRARVTVPAEFAGRSFVLRFPNNALLTTVFVNGKLCGTSKAPCTNFDCDVTTAVRPGETNEVVVGIKDAYYAVARTGEGKSCRYLFNYPHGRFYESGGLGPTRFADFPVLNQVRRTGILETPSLIVGGLAYSADVFAVPSVAKKQLGLEVTVHNPTGRPAEVTVRAAVRPAAGGEVVKSFTDQTVTVPAGESAIVKPILPWADPRLWWPDDPHLHAVTTTLLIGGNPVDETTTTFGFREWGWRGTAFTLNGVPWHLRADLRHADPQPGLAADAAVREWRRNGQNTFRFWGEKPWTGATQRETLDFFDRNGVIVRRTGTFDGQVASYQLVIDGKPNTALFDNWRTQLAAWVKAERNHPSVMIWSLENEITYINARNFGWLPQVEPEIKKAADAVMALDPTRPVMVDGGDALMDQSLPVAGNHYLERDKRDYPDEAYTLAKALTRHKQPRPWDPWPIPADKPLFLGESYFANGSPPAAYAEIEGEAAFLGRREAARGVTKFARMLSEGYRWHGVAAFHFWFAEGADAEHYKAWQPVCVLCREWDTAFPAAATVTRTLKAFNDTRSAEPVTVHWLFLSRGTSPVTELRGKKTIALPPGGAEEFTIDLPMPAVPPGGVVDGELVLLCMRDGKVLFRDARACRVLGATPKLAAPAAEVALWDPAGKAAAWLANLCAFTPVPSLDAVPAACKVLVVGPDAVTPALATDPVWKGLAARGLRVLVLDQANPLHYLAVPADAEPTAYTGRVAFPENLRHPAFAGLTRDDFFCWSAGHVVYRNAYRKPTRGGRSLAQCDVELSCSPLIEAPVGSGLLLLSQFAVGEKPADPVARRLTANLLRYALDYKPAAKPTAVLLPDADPRRKLLTTSGLKVTPAEDVIDALDKAEVVVTDGTPAALDRLAASAGKVRAFTEGGGWLVLWGVTPDGLAAFNKLVGFDHVIRPFKRERVTLPAIRDPLVTGLSLRDVALESAEKIYPWAGDRYPADDTFTHVVDLTDAAPFVRDARPAFGWSQMTNGLTSADSWKFIFYHDLSKEGDRPVWTARLAKTEEVTGLTVVINAHYRKITRLRVRFDNNPSADVVVSLKPEAELRQEFTFPARPCRTIGLEPVEWTDDPKPVIGIDNLWLTVRRPADFPKRVVPLLNIGALVAYPAGKGGILLNQVRVGETEANPENAGKKQTLVATLLRNLGAEFAAERVVVPGANLAYTPVPLGEKCNTYLTADRGWPAGPGDLARFPVGEQTFAGVRYDVRDFRTSPLPAAVALVPGKADAVAGIPVRQRADALFFLHAFHPTNPLKPGEQPTVGRYSVRYADGSMIEVPVRVGREVGPWVADAANPLPDAAVAWSAPFADGKGPAGKRAVVYQAQWTNPRPGDEIVSVDVTGVAAADRIGIPILLGITAATEKK